VSSSGTLKAATEVTLYKILKEIHLISIM